MTSTTINIARDFSKFPGGRYLKDGKFTGERFRDELLAPALQRYDCVNVEFDDALGYGSSFLEEAFGGLVREKGFAADDLESRLKIITEDEDLDYSIGRYIQDARSKTLVSR